LKQIVHLNDQMKKEITHIEEQCERLGEKLQKFYQDDFNRINERIVIELIREIKGKPATTNDIFIENYESYLELGVEKEIGYYPNAYIPVWKCRREMFQNIGLLISEDFQSLEKKLKKIIVEMCEDHKGEED
jgi:hypothetical protein